MLLEDYSLVERIISIPEGWKMLLEDPSLVKRIISSTTMWFPARCFPARWFQCSWRTPAWLSILERHRQVVARQVDSMLL